MNHVRRGDLGTRDVTQTIKTPFNMQTILKKSRSAAQDCSPLPSRYLVVLVDDLACIDDREVRDEVGHFFLGLGPDEHVLGEMVLPR